MKGERHDISRRNTGIKKGKNAVILVHYYVRPEVQEIADHIGDSFYLSKVAVGLKEQTIVFCGVSFMGESAKVLNPEKTVLMPDMDADCPMAHMADAETIQKMREKFSLFRIGIWHIILRSRFRKRSLSIMKASVRRMNGCRQKRCWRQRWK